MDDTAPSANSHMPLAFPLITRSPLCIANILALVGSMKARAETSGVSIVPLCDGEPVLAELVFVTGFDGECVEDAAQRAEYRLNKMGRD